MTDKDKDVPLTSEQLGEVSGGGNFTPGPPKPPGSTPSGGAAGSGTGADAGDGGTSSQLPPPPTPGAVG